MPATKTKTAKDKHTLDYLQAAVSDLTAARSQANDEAHAKIDEAIDKLRDATDQLTDRARSEATNWEKTLEKAGDDALREIGRMTIRAQRTPAALTDLSSEIRKRKAQLSA